MKSGTGSGSPLQARLTVGILPIVLIFLSLAVIAAIIYFINKALKAYKNSPEHLQKIKNRPTKYKDV